MEVGFGKLTFTFPQDIPLVGGKTVDIDLNMIPSRVMYDGNKIMIAVGWDSADKDKKSFKEKISAVKSLTKAKTWDMGKLKGAINSKYPMGAVLGNTKPTFEIVGYLEGIIPKDGVEFSLNREFMLRVGLKSKTEFQTVIAVVPVTILLDIEANAALGGRFTLLGNKLKPALEMEFIIPHIEVRGGVGVAYVASVGAYGSADLTIQWNLLNGGSRSILSGEFGAYARLLFIEHKIPAKNGKLYDSGVQQVSRSAFSAVTYDVDNYTTPAPRTYLGSQSPWLGETMSRQRNAGGIKVLKESIYDQTAPLIAEANGKRVMVFLDDEGSRSDMNRTKLVYTVSSNNGATWGEPTTVFDDGTADFYPQIASDGSNIWVAWHNSSRVFDDDAKLKDMLAASEISVARFDNNLGVFANVETLTGTDTNGIMDSQPKIAVNGSEAVVSWIQNAEDDIFAENKLNKILSQKYANNSWETLPTEIESELGVVVDMAAGYLGNNARIAYITDDDNNLNSIDKRTLTVKDSSGNVTNTPTSSKLVSNPKFAKINNANVLYWYEDGNVLYMTADGTITPLFDEPDMLVDNFKIVGEEAGKAAVIYPASLDGIGYFMARLQNSSGWGAPFKLAETGDYARYFDDVRENEAALASPSTTRIWTFSAQETMRYLLKLTTYV